LGNEGRISRKKDELPVYPKEYQQFNKLFQEEKDATALPKHQP
jgi:hypothetical protein